MIHFTYIAFRKIVLIFSWVLKSIYKEDLIQTVFELFVWKKGGLRRKGLFDRKKRTRCKWNNYVPVNSQKRIERTLAINAIFDIYLITSSMIILIKLDYRETETFNTFLATLGEGGSYCSFTRVGLILTRNKRQNVSPRTFLIYRIYFWILLFRLFVSTRWCSVAGFLSRTRWENKPP